MLLTLPVIAAASQLLITLLVFI